MAKAEEEEAACFSEQEPRRLLERDQDEQVDKTPRWSERGEEVDKKPRWSERGEEVDKTPRWSERGEEADKTPRWSERDKAQPCSDLEKGKEAATCGETELQTEAAPSPSRHQDGAKKPGPESLLDATTAAATTPMQKQSDANAAFAAAALLPRDSTGKRKNYRVWQNELRQAIGRYFPGEAMKIRHDSTFKQMAGWLQTLRGTNVDLANLTGEEALRQVLPPGTNFGRGSTAVYHAVLRFLYSQDP